MPDFGPSHETVSFTFPVTVESPVVVDLTITPRSPLPRTGVHDPESPVVVDVTATDLDSASVFITINGLVVWENGLAAPWATVARDPITNGFRFTVLLYPPYPYSSEVSVYVYAATTTAINDAVTWRFSIIEDPTCFIGPNNDLENVLLSPYPLASTILPSMERLRKCLLESAVANANVHAAIRALFVRTLQSDVRTMLFGSIAVPTDAEKAVRICHKNTIVTQAQLIGADYGLIAPAIAELRRLGMPQQHQEMLLRHLNTGDPAVWVPLACVVVFLAKLMENDYRGITL